MAPLKCRFDGTLDDALSDLFDLPKENGTCEWNDGALALSNDFQELLLEMHGRMATGEMATEEGEFDWSYSDTPPSEWVEGKPPQQVSRLQCLKTYNHEPIEDVWHHLTTKFIELVSAPNPNRDKLTEAEWTMKLSKHTATFARMLISTAHHFDRQWMIIIERAHQLDPEVLDKWDNML